MNPETTVTLDEAVKEVLGLLTGLDLTYAPELDRYGAITRQLNRALRSNALEHEWSYYSAMTNVATAAEGLRVVTFDDELRPRITGDDAVLLQDEHGQTQVWAYFLPRDALHKYFARGGLWCSATRTSLYFSRPLDIGEAGLSIMLPVMREPTMFRLPVQPEDPDEPLVEVPDEIRSQPIDFVYPDVVILRAAYYYAQTDPVIQPRVQTLEAQYKDLMYQIIERDDRFTDTPFLNEFLLPIQSGIDSPLPPGGHPHPHADTGR